MSACPNKRILSLVKLITAWTVLTVIAVLHEQGPFLLELKD